MLDIKGGSTNPLVARLSNFTDRPFVLDGFICQGLEGFFQALKCPDIEIQKDICLLKGRDAKKRGADYNSWKETQTLHWKGKAYARSSRDYLLLITRAYDVAYKQDVTFKEDLLALGYEQICHSIGNPDMRETVLTEVEMLYQLNRLRIHALGEKNH